MNLGIEDLSTSDYSTFFRMQISVYLKKNSRPSACEDNVWITDVTLSF